MGRDPISAAAGKRAGALVALGVLLLPGQARAGNDDEVPIGGQAALSGAAVTATTSDGAAAWYNPAGIVSVARDTVDVSGSVFALRLYRVPSFLSTSEGEAADASANELVSIPSAVTLVRPLGPDARVAIGLFVPQSSDVRLREQLSAEDPVPSLWILDLASATQAYHGALALGARLGERVRIGVTLGGVYREETARAEFFGGIMAPDGETAVVGTTVDAEIWTVGLDLTAGLQWDATDVMTLGFSVRTPSLDFFSSRETDTVNTSARAGGTASPTVELVPQASTRQGANVSSLQPLRARAGLAFRIGSGWLALDGDVQPAWTDDEFGIRREAVWNARLGGIFRVSDRISLGAGLFTDRAADPQPTDFLESRVQFYGASAGFALDNVHGLDEEEEADTIVFSSTVALRYAYGAGQVAGLLIDFAGDQAVRTRQADITVHELALHIGSELYF